MNWERILLDTAQSPDQLPGKLQLLFQHQRSAWKLFREGEEALSRTRTKVFERSADRVVVQTNPGRRRSTFANVDPAAVARRPCPLCPEQLPDDERGIGFDEFILLPNPYPVLAGHCTIIAREHRPQELSGGIEKLLLLARALGPAMLVFYNGPRCGASAPDHYHLQACDSAAVPVLQTLARLDPLPARIPHTSFGRRMLVLTSDDAEKVEKLLWQSIEVLRKISTEGEDQEPMFNLLCHWDVGKHRVVVFPRAKHRPACFFAESVRQIAVSPATLEMAGLLVVPEPLHFDRIDEPTVLSIYQEVSLDEGQFNRWIGDLP